MFYYVPGINKYLMYIHLQNPYGSWKHFVDNLGNGNSKKLVIFVPRSAWIGLILKYMLSILCCIEPCLAFKELTT